MARQRNLVTWFFEEPWAVVMSINGQEYRFVRTATRIGKTGNPYPVAVFGTQEAVGGESC